ncbi:MAG: extracellular solute-binding protein [Planctomycetota bacterium]
MPAKGSEPMGKGAGAGSGRRVVDRLPPWLGALSAGCWLIVVLGLLGGGVALWGRGGSESEIGLWVFSPMHQRMYEPIIEDWNAAEEEDGDDPSDRARVSQSLLGRPALRQRMLSGFFGGLPTADLIEVERTIAGQLFAGPLDAVGFVDLTDRIREEGLLEAMPPAAFSPWTSRGRIFGLPHDVHPVMLGVRMDLIEDAGLSIEGVETWEDFAAALRPLMADEDGDGEPDRYLLGLWPGTLDRDKIEMLLLQGGTGLFAADGSPVIASDANARVLAQMVSWCVGPNRFAADVPDFQPAGNQLKVDGYAIAFFMPDWMCNYWKNELQMMSGTLELMPLPALEPGGRRTSVWGGTMLGIPKTATDVEAAWAFAKRLYLSPELARAWYTEGDIITPIRTHWDDPVFDTPDPYFRGQAKGRLYVQHASQVPTRHASPFTPTAIQRVADAATGLLRYAQDNDIYEVSSLEPEAKRRLEIAQTSVERLMDANLFLGEAEAASELAP